MQPWHHRACPTLAPCKALPANPSGNAAAHPRTGSTAMARGLTSSVSKSTCRSEPSSRALSILSRPLSVQNMARRRWSTASPSGLMSPARGTDVVGGWGRAAPGPVTVPWPTAKGCEHRWRTPQSRTAPEPPPQRVRTWLGPPDVALGRCHRWWEHTWTDNGLRLSAWLQTRPAYGPAGHISPIDRLLPAVVVDPHHDGALPGLREGHGVKSCLDHGREAQWALISPAGTGSCPGHSARCNNGEWCSNPFSPANPNTDGLLPHTPPAEPCSRGFFRPAVAGTHPRPDGCKKTLRLKERLLQQQSRPEEWPSGWGKGILGKVFQFPRVQGGSRPSF